MCSLLTYNMPVDPRPHGALTVVLSCGAASTNYSFVPRSLCVYSSNSSCELAATPRASHKVARDQGALLSSVRRALQRRTQHVCASRPQHRGGTAHCCTWRQWFYRQPRVQGADRPRLRSHFHLPQRPEHSRRSPAGWEPADGAAARRHVPVVSAGVRLLALPSAS